MKTKTAKNFNEDKIRLLIVLNTLGAGGAETQLSRIATRLNKNIFDVQVVYYNKIGLAHPAEILIKAGIKVTYLDRPKWGRILYLFKAAAFMKRNKIDIVHAWHGTANYYATIPAIMARVPVILGGLRGKHDSDFGWILKSIVNIWCALWVTNAKSIKEIALHKMKFVDGKKIIVIPNGLEINDNNISKQDSTTFFDHFRTERPVIGTVSRLDPIKNLMLFIHMARQLIQQGYEADFWIIGEGPMRSEIESAIEKYSLKNYVKMFGYRTDIALALSKMDVFVLTSDSEGCPNVLLEAMQASLPIVSTNCSSLEQMVEQGINGYTVPVGDLTSLVEKVQSILSNPEKRKVLGINSRQIIKQRFELSIIVKQFEQVYLNCLTKLSRKRGQLNKNLRP